MIPKEPLALMVVYFQWGVLHILLFQYSFADDESIIVQTTSGRVMGVRRFHDNINIGRGRTASVVDSFLGIPFAEPPIKNLRFRDPVPERPWTGIKDATRIGPACPQRLSSNETPTEKQDEDCLYLNIYSPFQVMEPKKLFPVMVYIHGGSFIYGTGNKNNGTALSMFGVVAVSLNYRLGALGFLTTGTKELPGNYGIKDQIRALEWIQKNIRSFRGDPDRVTIFGSSAGGASVGIIYLSPMGRGLFHRAIAESGTANAMWASHLDKAEKQLTDEARMIAGGMNCNKSNLSDMVDCLRTVDLNLLTMEEICKNIPCSEVDPLTKPVVDGVVLMGNPSDLLKRKTFNPRVPYMTGVVRAEFGHFFNDFCQTMCREVDDYLITTYGPPVAQAIAYHYADWNSAAGVGDAKFNQSIQDLKTFSYDRAQVLSDLGLVAPSIELASSITSHPAYDGSAANAGVYFYYLDFEESYHSVELNYVYGLPFIGGSVDEVGKDYDALVESPDFVKQTSRIIMRLWTNFAKYGNPNGKDGGPDSMVGPHAWTKFGSNSGNYLKIRSTPSNLSIEILQNFRQEKTALWNILVSNLASACPRTMESVTNSVNMFLLIGLISSILTFLLLLASCVCFVRIRHKKSYRKKSSEVTNGKPACPVNV